MIACIEGKEFPLADCRGLSGMFFDYDGEGPAMLVCAFPGITKEEQRLCLTTPGKIGLFKYDGIIFVSAKFGPMDGDCAYHVQKHDNYGKIQVAAPGDGEGMSLAIFAVDSRTNTLVGQRLCGMGTIWTRDFGRMIEEQKQEPYDEAEFLAKVGQCQMRWNTKALMRLSQIYRLGTKIEQVPIKRS